MAAKARFSDPEVLERQIEDYFEGIKAAHVPPTLSGLAFVLGVTRKTLSNYIRECEDEEGGKSKKAECGRLLMMAKARIECWLEEQLVTRGKTKGIEFALKNNYDWSDKMNVNVDGKTEHSGEVDVKLTAAKLTDEELLNRIELLTARANEIRRREGAAQ
jgi:hypothetical protein